jgi:hypothetical protein
MSVWHFLDERYEIMNILTVWGDGATGRFSNR